MLICKWMTQNDKPRNMAKCYWTLNLLKESMHEVKKIWHIIPSHTQTQNQIIVQDPNIKQ